MVRRQVHAAAVAAGWSQISSSFPDWDGGHDGAVLPIELTRAEIAGCAGDQPGYVPLEGAELLADLRLCTSLAPPLSGK
jgi:hypothetical protein